MISAASAMMLPKSSSAPVVRGLPAMTTPSCPLRLTARSHYAHLWHVGASGPNRTGGSREGIGRAAVGGQTSGGPAPRPARGGRFYLANRKPDRAWRFLHGVPVIAAAAALALAGCGSQRAATTSVSSPATAAAVVAAPTPTTTARKYGVYGFPGSEELSGAVSQAVQQQSSEPGFSVGGSWCTLQSDAVASCYVEYSYSGGSDAVTVLVTCHSIDAAGGHDCRMDQQ